METDKTIQILMSTYNGEKYLREQLDSFLNQTCYDKIKVLIRDDGSTDGTRNILLEYKQKYGFELIFGDNIGCNESMLCLLEKCDKSCEYYALSDQDDVWYNDKIERAVNALEKCRTETAPVMFSSRSCITDENLRPIGFSEDPHRELSFYNAAVQNVCPGHTQVLNRYMVNMLLNQPYCDEIFVLDYWNYILAAAFGKVIFDHNCSVYHRQHSNNTVGYATNFWQSTLNRIKRISIKNPDPSAVQLNAFRIMYKKRLGKEYYDSIDKFFNCQKDFLHRLKYAFSMRFYRQSIFETALFRFLYLLGKYHL